MSGARRWEAALHRRMQRTSSLRFLFISCVIFALNYAIRRHKYSSKQNEFAPGPNAASSEPMPKIALLFLTKGPLPHEATWRAWFEAASHLLPRNELLKRCNREPTEVLKELVAECEALQPYAVDAIASQLLYSVYIHAPPSFQGYPSGALWDGYLIQERVDTKWGDHSLSIATRALISAALVNPGNQWFVLVSESDIPLYDPLTFYLQLMSENKSRVNACEGGNSMSHR